MTLSRTRKKTHKLNLIGETNKKMYYNQGCDYTKILSPNQKVPKGQARLKPL